MPDSRSVLPLSRQLAIIGATAAALASLALTLSLSLPSFGIENWFTVPGNWLFGIYGYSALVIPGYLLAASIVLFDKDNRPESLFLFGWAILPLLTLLLGAASIISDRWNLPVVSSASIIAIAVAVEILLIGALWVQLFSSQKPPSRSVNYPASSRLEVLPADDADWLVSRQSPSADEWSDLNTIPASRYPEWRLPELRGLSSLRAEAEVGSAAGLSQGLSAKAPIKPSTQTDQTAQPPNSLPATSSVDQAAYQATLERFGAFVLAKEESLDTVAELKTADSPDDSQLSTEGLTAAEADEPNNDDPAIDDLEMDDLEVDDLEVDDSEVDDPENENAESNGEPSCQPAGAKRTLQGYKVPVEGLLQNYPDGQYWIIDQATRDAALILKKTLEEFKIQAEVTGIRKGPVITMFEILPAPGVKLSKIVNLQDNIALRLAASSVRIVAPIPGKHAVGIEVPNRKRNIVSFREIIDGELNREGKRAEIPVILGKDITGEAQTLDLVQTPHLLIAGATGSGKSVCVNSMILSILYQRTPAEVRLILIDPKIVELKLYNDIPHLLTPVITEPKRAFQALQYCIYEMERRYALLDSMGVRDIRSYNRRIKERNLATERLPYIVVVIDEFADLMATTGKELESTVARLAAMSRAIGVHLVLATQRPSIDVITGLIKANIPSRIAFMVASKMDSRIIIDMVGAEKLLGRGDLLFASAWDPFPTRMQGAFVSEEEVERVVDYVKTLGEPDYIDEEIFYDEEEDDSETSLFSEDDDPLYEKALEIVIQQGKASASYIQRRLKIGYNRAARLVEEMEDRGIVGPAQGSKPRDLLRGV